MNTPRKPNEESPSDILDLLEGNGATKVRRMKEREKKLEEGRANKANKGRGSKENNSNLPD